MDDFLKFNICKMINFMSQQLTDDLPVERKRKSRFLAPTRYILYCLHHLFRWHFHFLPFALTLQFTIYKFKDMMAFCFLPVYTALHHCHIIYLLRFVLKHLVWWRFWKTLLLSRALKMRFEELKFAGINKKIIVNQLKQQSHVLILFVSNFAG